MLSVENLRVELSGKIILSDVSFRMNRGEVTGLLGPNGSGKSTLIRSVAGLVRKSGGRIVFDGSDIGSISPKRRARTLAYVPQNTSFEAPYTVLESVVMGRYPHLEKFGRYGVNDYKISSEALERVGLAGFEERTVTTLSGGESARVAIARALVQDSPVILLDEPMASLDPKHSLIIGELIRKLTMEGRAVLMAMHDVNLALGGADKVIFLKEGSVFGDMRTKDVDEKILMDVYDIPWEIWSIGNGRGLVAIPGADDYFRGIKKR
jgi:iron complex transport system ATP-binding protein